MASVYGHTHVKAWHTNLIFGLFVLLFLAFLCLFPDLFAHRNEPSLLSQPIPYLSKVVSPLTDFEKKIFERVKWFQEEGLGYFYQQSTNPQTLGYSLADSPSGLLGWIWEKLYLGSDKYPWTDDEGIASLQIPTKGETAWLTSISAV